MAEPSFDVGAAHRWFAIELNNATWAWLESQQGADHNDPIIHTAHASYHHWRHAGEVINQARAASLVANVHAACGNGELSLALAQECMTLLTEAGEQTTDWDIAFGHDSLARAFAALDRSDAAEQRERARAYGDAIADPDNKQVFDDWFNHA